ncbi:MAG: extracellular solute-binding protein [Chloroflexi bacterium]|nr:extracellular solute-binding protein [Chloroflexota bacterium]
MKTLFWLTIVLVTGSIVLAACAQPLAPPAAPEAKGPAAKVASRAAWEEKWESTLARAKQEGVVRVYSGWGAETRVLLSQAFKDKYGIELEFTPFSKSAEIVARVQAEKRAGLNIADVFGAGATTQITMMKPEGLLGPIEGFLILPEVTDPRAWQGEKPPFVDKDKRVIGMIAGLQRQISYNTTMVKEGEITSYKDLLKPQYKGKIAMADPSLSGTANAMFGHLAYDLWNQEEASDWLRQLIKQQEAIIQREHRLVVEWVARGKYPVGIGGQYESVAEFMNLGAPISVAVQKEGHSMDYAAGGLGVPTVSPHPNAAAVFVNWLLTKEGQTLFAVKGYGYPSRRLDVPTEGINPVFLPRPGEKVFYASEEAIVFRGKMMEVARKIMEEASRK